MPAGGRAGRQEHAGAFARIAQTQGALAAASALASGPRRPRRAPRSSAPQEEGPDPGARLPGAAGPGSKAMAANAPSPRAASRRNCCITPPRPRAHPRMVAGESRAMDAYTRVVWAATPQASPALLPVPPAGGHDESAEFEHAVAHSCKQPAGHPTPSSPRWLPCSPAPCAASTRTRAKRRWGVRAGAGQARRRAAEGGRRGVRRGNRQRGRPGSR